jgi:DNA-binding winged helix-turn-helix (wHTH) protein/Flp pilus assembly protein TadD
VATLYRFGPFELDLDCGELRRDGAAVKLSPQPFKALTVFVSRAGGLVTRDELRRALWADDNHVDFNAGVNFCIAQLRAALDDPAARSAYIVAVPRRGYRFVANLVPVEPAPVPVAKRSPLAAAAAGLAVATAAWVAFSGGGGALPPLEARRYYELGALALADAAPAELRNRVKFFDRAIALHPALGDAHAGLAHAWMTLGAYREERPIFAYAAAKAAAVRAVALSPESADAHAALGAARLFYDWDWPGAHAALSRALAIDPESARAHAWMSRYQSASGRHREAIAHAREADRLQPGSPSARTALGIALFYAGRFTDAESTCERAARLAVSFVPAWRCARSAAAERGDLRRVMTFWNGLAAVHRPEAPALAAARNRPDFSLTAYWRDRLASAQTIPESDPNWQSVTAAIAAAHAGDTPRALQWLERAASRRVDQLIFAAVHPAFKDLHGEPRFEAILERIGLGRWSARDRKDDGK